MSTAWRWFSRALLMLCALMAVLAALWAYGRLTSPTAAQLAAIDQMHRDEPGAGENGYPLMMALPPEPEGGLPDALRCDERASCIEAIEAAPEANAAAIEASRARLEVAARALRAPVFRNPGTTGTPGVDDLPPYGPVMSIDALRALQFSAGQTVEALDHVCADTLGAVRWATNPDVLIEAMIGIAIVRQNAALIADMRRRAPRDPLPPSCRALAEAPDPAVEGTMCNALRGEWHYQRRLFPELERQMAASPDGRWAKTIAPLVNDVDWQLATSAAHFASACGDDARRAAAEDRADTPVAPPLRWVDSIAFANSAMLMTIAMPAYGDYAARQLDYVALRRLLAAFLQMEAMDAALTNAQRFEALPAALRDGPRPLVFDAEGGSLEVPLRAPRDGGSGNVMRLGLPGRAGAPTVVAIAP